MLEATIHEAALFKIIMRTPLSGLKSLTDDELQSAREILAKEVREVGRALQWIEGVMRLKKMDEQKASKL